jgi:hypothetical protein
VKLLTSCLRVDHAVQQTLPDAIMLLCLGSISQGIKFQHFVIFAFEPDHAGSPPITQLLVDALPRHPDQARKIALRNSEIDANRITIFAAVGLGQPKKLSRKPRTRIEKNGILDQGLAAAQAFAECFHEPQAYVKVGDPLKGNPFVHCPAFDWEVSGAQLIAAERLTLPLGGADLALDLELISDTTMPRDVCGQIQVEPQNGAHGFRPVYFLGRQIDDSKAYTSPLFITFI